MSAVDSHPLGRWLRRILELIGAVSFLVTFGATLLGMAARYFQLQNVDWSFEISGISFIWLTFIGCTLAELHRENVNFNGLIKHLPASLQKVLDMLINLLLIVSSVWLVISGYLVLQRSGWVPTPVLRWPSGITMIALVSAGVMLALIALVRIVRPFIASTSPVGERS